MRERDTRGLGRRLAAARAQAALSQMEAAQALGVTPAAVSQYEAGKRKIDALALERLARLYAVPITFFFQDIVEELPDWAVALRELSRDLSPEGKVGISVTIERVRDLETLHQVLGVPTPGLPHAPFPTLPEAQLPDYQVRYFAEEARGHFGLGKAPLHDMKGFLEANGYLVFTVPLGRNRESDLSGMFFQHPQLGRIVVINEDQSYTRWPFTLAHELAHSLFHYDRTAILCRRKDARPIEEFADSFAGHFLVPESALHDQLGRLGVKTVTLPSELVKLARHFGVSFRAMAWRLASQNRLQIPRAELDGTKPVKLAQALGFRTNPYEFGVRPLPLEERYPRTFLQLAYQAAKEQKLSLRRVADMLGVSHFEVQDRLDTHESDEEREDFDEVPS